MLAPRTSTTTATMWPPLAMPEPDVCAPIDANGNLTSDGGRSFEWDSRNQLLTVSAGSLRKEWSYGHLGNKANVRKFTSGTLSVESELVYCGVRLCESRSITAAPTQRIFGRGMVEDTDSQFLTLDHLGSIRDVVENSSLVSRFSYAPFGEATVEAGQLSSEGFAQLVQEPDIADLAHGSFRTLDAVSGRWISQDPIGLAGGINLYGYGLNNPVNSIDPLGLSSCTTVMSFPASFAQMGIVRRTYGPKRLTFDRSDYDGGPNFYGSGGVTPFGLPSNLIRCGWERDVKVVRPWTRKWVDVNLCDSCYGPYVEYAERLERWTEIEEHTERGFFNVPSPMWIAEALAGEACRKFLPFNQ